MKKRHGHISVLILAMVVACGPQAQIIDPDSGVDPLVDALGAPVDALDPGIDSGVEPTESYELRINFYATGIQPGTTTIALQSESYVLYTSQDLGGMVLHFELEPPATGCQLDSVDFKMRGFLLDDETTVYLLVDGLVVDQQLMGSGIFIRSGTMSADIVPRDSIVLQYVVSNAPGAPAQIGVYHGLARYSCRVVQ